jgi:hypothetical protein
MLRPTESAEYGASWILAALGIRCIARYMKPCLLTAVSAWWCHACRQAPHVASSRENALSTDSAPRGPGRRAVLSALGLAAASAPLALARIGPNGTGRLLIRNGTGSGAPIVVDSSRSGVSIPDEGDYVRPKWGIYRSVESAASDIIDTHLRIRKYQAYRGV